jgi:hypothetical protein
MFTLNGHTPNVFYPKAASHATVANASMGQSRFRSRDSWGRMGYSRGGRDILPCLLRGMNAAGRMSAWDEQHEPRWVDKK